MVMKGATCFTGPPCLTLLRPAGRPPLKQPYGGFRGGPPTGRAAYGHLLPLGTPYPVRLCLHYAFTKLSLLLHYAFTFGIFTLGKYHLAHRISLKSTTLKDIRLKVSFMIRGTLNG
jgi:hypothetical protein